VLQSSESALHDAVRIPELSEKILFIPTVALAAFKMDHMHRMVGGVI
jgi:hypothetical protein